MIDLLCFLTSLQVQDQVTNPHSPMLASARMPGPPYGSVHRHPLITTTSERLEVSRSKEHKCRDKLRSIFLISAKDMDP